MISRSHSSIALTAGLAASSPRPPAQSGLIVVDHLLGLETADDGCLHRLGKGEQFGLRPCASNAGKPGVKAMDECDPPIMVGTDFPYRDFYPKSARTIQIDWEPTRIGRRHPVDIGLVAHAGPTLAALTERVAKRESGSFLEAIQAEMARWRESRDKDEASDSVPIAPPRVLKAVSDAAPDDTIFIADTGTATAWAARHLRIRSGQRFTLSGGLATMAIGLPGAIGAQLAYPQRRVVAIVGDGAFSMLVGDLVTAVRYELPVVIVVLNNAKLGFITLEQEAKGLPDWGTDISNPDFTALAEACGALGISVTDPSELSAALAAGLRRPQACGRQCQRRSGRLDHAAEDRTIPRR
ncbi:MAG: thiamine pyrophosphate-dependent enzyme [Woeseiaceae bacterium]|nr:thiamine pyrophosphate-dependent enzyme [Woeseiaceae bacterium]